MSSVAAIVLLLACFISLPIIWKVIRMRNLMQDGSEKEAFEEKCGTLTEGLRADYSILASYWNLLTLVRWTLTTLILIVMKDYDEFQILSLLLISVVYSAFLIRGRPFEDSFQNKMSLFTEIVVSIYLYLLLCLTDFTG